MGRSASKLTRKVETSFNIEHRAQRAIEKQRTIPKAPPKHASSVELLKQMEKSESNFSSIHQSSHEEEGV